MNKITGDKEPYCIFYLVIEQEFALKSDILNILKTILK